MPRSMSGRGPTGGPAGRPAASGSGGHRGPPQRRVAPSWRLNPRRHPRAVPGPSSRYMDMQEASEARSRTTSLSPLVAAPHLAAVDAARGLSLPLLGILARISLTVALREVREVQTGVRVQDAVGNAESPPWPSRPDVAEIVVVHPPEAVRPARHDEVWSIAAGSCPFPPYRGAGQGPRRSAGVGVRVRDVRE
jgi:hypothetical protein